MKMKLIYIRNWVLIGLSCLFYCVSFAQDCGYYMDNSYNSYFIIPDSTLLDGDNYFLLLEHHDGIINSYKLTQETNSQYLLTSSINNRIIRSNVCIVENSIFNIDFVDSTLSIHLWGSRVHSGFNMLIIKQGNRVLNIIPTGSTIQNNLICLKEINRAYFEKVENILKIILGP
jgi:hypothetical protein